MSTRCHIGFYNDVNDPDENFEVLLYRHSDGYPEGVLPDVVPFLITFNRDRGIHDLEYCAARLLQHMTNTHDEEMKQYLKDRKNDEILLLGYGISKRIHGDIEYLYKISPNAFRICNADGSTIEEVSIKELGTWWMEKQL